MNSSGKFNLFITTKFAVVALFLCSLAAQNAAAGQIVFHVNAHKPTPLEAKLLRSALGLIYKYGPDGSYSWASDLLTSHKIDIAITNDNSLKEALVKRNLFGNIQHLYLYESTFNDIATYTDVSKKYEEKHKIGDNNPLHADFLSQTEAAAWTVSYRLASMLIHEWTHTTQSLAYSLAFPNVTEKEALYSEISFYKAIPYQKSRYHEQALGDASDAVQARIDEINGQK